MRQGEGHGEGGEGAGEGSEGAGEGGEGGKRVVRVVVWAELKLRLKKQVLGYLLSLDG